MPPGPLSGMPQREDALVALYPVVNKLTAFKRLDRLTRFS